MSPRKKFPTKDDSGDSRDLGCENVQKMIRDLFSLSTEELGKRYSEERLFQAQYHIVTCKECMEVFREEREHGKQADS